MPRKTPYSEIDDSEALLRELRSAEGQDPSALAAKAHALALDSGHSRVVVGAALSRALAGYWARLCHDAGEPPEFAAVAVRHSARETAELASHLVRAGRGGDEEASEA